MKYKNFVADTEFLHKVQERRVYSAVGHSQKRGINYITRGGLAAIDAHAKAGLIRRPCIASPGRPSYAELTDAGLAYLRASYASTHNLDRRLK